MAKPPMASMNADTSKWFDHTREYGSEQDPDAFQILNERRVFPLPRRSVRQAQQIGGMDGDKGG